MRLFIAIFLDLRAKSCYDIRANLIWRCIEVVVTRTTRNRFVLSRARGFESHHLRHAKQLPVWEAVFAFMVWMRSHRVST